MEKQFREILSEITGYTATELADRQTEPLLQPYDCLLAMAKALTIHSVVDTLVCDHCNSDNITELQRPIYECHDCKEKC